MTLDKIFEDLLDDIEVKRANAVNKIVDDIDNSTEFMHDFVFVISKLKTTDFHTVYLDPRSLNTICNAVEYICELSSLFQDYSIKYYFSRGLGEDDKETKFVYRDKLEELIYLSKDNKKNYDKKLFENQLNILITFSISPKATFKSFYKTFLGLYKTLNVILSDKYQYFLADDSVASSIDSITISDRDISYYYLQQEFWDKFEETPDISPEDRMSVFDRRGDFMDSNIQQKNVGRKYYFDTNPVKISNQSEKTLDELEPGDFLFYSQKDNTLTLDETNHPIAQFVSKVNGTYRFCALRYLSAVNPYKGSIIPYTNFRFGNINSKYERPGPEDVDINDGVALTENIINGMNLIGYKGPRTVQVVGNQAGRFESPLFQTVLLYKTLGTKSGQWYIPAPDELKSLHENKDIINNKRTQNGFQELADFFYFSSLEESDIDAVILDMYDGDNVCLISKRISKYNGIEETCAIGFIQVSE